MLELPSDQFFRAITLLSGIRQAVLPYAVCEGYNPGRIFVNDPAEPETVLIWTRVGYFFLAGIPTIRTDFSTLSECLETILIPAARAVGETGLILICSPGWDRQLPAILPNRSPIEIYRRTFTLNPEAFEARKKDLPPIPDGFTLVRMDEPLAGRIGVQSSWSSPQAFVERGIGYAILQSNQIVSACSSVFASSRAVELDVHTETEYRRRGLASITAAAVIEECLRQGKTPNWECFWENQTSVNLALKLGYQVCEDYPVYYWEEE